MFVIRLPNGNLQVPQTAIHTGDGRIIGDVYVEIGPQDADYDRLAAQAITPDEAEQRKDEWRAGDAALLFDRNMGDLKRFEFLDGEVCDCCLVAQDI